MNRENKRKSFEKGYYKTHACSEVFTCKNCGRVVVPEGAGSTHGKMDSNRIAADDNPMKLMSIAMKPLCEPPFPLDRIREMTAQMGGDGIMK